MQTLMPFLEARRLELAAQPTVPINGAKRPLEDVVETPLSTGGTDLALDPETKRPRVGSSPPSTPPPSREEGTSTALQTAPGGIYTPPTGPPLSTSSASFVPSSSAGPSIIRVCTFWCPFPGVLLSLFFLLHLQAFCGRDMMQCVWTLPLFLCASFFCHVHALRVSQLQKVNLILLQRRESVFVFRAVLC